MSGSLRPPVGGPRQLKDYWPSAVLVFATGLGGAVLGVAAAVFWFGLRYLPEARQGLVVAVGAIVLIALWYPSLRRWIPERACQVSDVPRGANRPSAAAARWGIPLGMGIRTYVVTPALYALLAITVSQRSAAASFLICLIYGLTRGSVMAYFALFARTKGSRDPGDGLAWTMRWPLRLTVLAAVAAVVA